MGRSQHKGVPARGIAVRKPHRKEQQQWEAAQQLAQVSAWMQELLHDPKLPRLG